MEVGEEWAYAGSDNTYNISRVQIIRLDGNRASVAYLDADGVPGYKRSVLTRNLRVLWDDHWDYFHRARVLRADETAEVDAVTFVLDALVPYDVARLYDYRTGDLIIEEPEAMSELCALKADDLSADVVDGFKVARALVEKNAQEILFQLDEEERRDLYEAMRAEETAEYYWSYMVDDAERRERLVQRAGRMTRRRNAVIRTWAGEQEEQTAKLVQRLRLDVVETRAAAQRALSELKATAKSQRANRIVEELEKFLADRS